MGYFPARILSTFFSFLFSIPDISDLSLAEIRRIVNLVRQIDLDVLYDDDLLNVNLADDELIVTSKDEEELFINIDSDELEVLLDDDELNIKISCQ